MKRDLKSQKGNSFARRLILAERKQKSAYAVHSKVKPVVVRHLLKDQIAAIADPSMKGDTVRLSDTSLSPRFYGNQPPPYYGRP